MSCFNSPLSIEKADRLIDVLCLSGGSTVIDVGCGKGEFLIRVLERYEAIGTGIDPDRAEIDCCELESMSRLRHGCLTLLSVKAEDLVWPESLYDAAFCIGSVHAFGTFEDAALQLRERVRPGGLILLGDLFWHRQPIEAYADFLGEGWPSFDLDFASLGRLGESQGLVLLYSACANRDEWDHFEGSFAARRIRQAFSAEATEGRDSLITKARDWYRAYLQWGRETMGFGFYVYQVPED